MSQNFGNTSNPTAGGAGTGATDAGTTRDTSTGTTGAAGGSTGLTTGGAATGTAAARTGTAQEYSQKLADAASTARDYVSDKLSVAKDKFGDLQNVDYRQAADQAKEYARQNPGQALLISAAAGFLLGLLLRSTRR
jgi:ElaB/YqjD/DUF883 family membrane-anchored ribosome-binding protein